MQIEAWASWIPYRWYSGWSTDVAEQIH